MRDSPKILISDNLLWTAVRRVSFIYPEVPWECCLNLYHAVPSIDDGLIKGLKVQGFVLLSQQVFRQDGPDSAAVLPFCSRAWYGTNRVLTLIFEISSRISLHGRRALVKGRSYTNWIYSKRRELHGLTLVVQRVFILGTYQLPKVDRVLNPFRSHWLHQRYLG